MPIVSKKAMIIIVIVNYFLYSPWNIESCLVQYMMSIFYVAVFPALDMVEVCKGIVIVFFRNEVYLAHIHLDRNFVNNQ